MLRSFVPLSMAAACGMAFAATQEVVVEAVDANGASVSEVVCDIVNRSGAWRVVTPAVAQITPSGDWMQVKCAKGLDLAGSATSIDTNGLVPRRPATGFARELAGAPVPAKVRVVLRDMTGAAPKSSAPTQTVRAAPPATALPAFVTKAPAPPEAVPVVIAAAPPVIAVPAQTAPPPVEAAVPASEAATPAAPQAVAPAIVAAAVVPPTAAQPVPEAAPVPPAPEPIAAGTTIAAAAVTAALPATAAAATPAPVAPTPVAPAAQAPRDFYDVKAVPFIAAEGRSAYTNFLAYPMPRAFAISKAGGWGFGVHGSDPGKLALDNCERRAGPCELYAVDRRVVWAGGNP